MKILRKASFLVAPLFLVAAVACGASDTTPASNPAGGPVNTSGAPDPSKTDTSGKPDSKKTDTSGKPDPSKTNGPAAPAGGAVNTGGAPDLSKTNTLGGGKDGGK